MIIRQKIKILIVAVATLSLWLGGTWLHNKRNEAATVSCIYELRRIDGAKQQWAIEQHKYPTEVPTWTDLQPYLHKKPQCPDAGTYTLRSVAENPICSIGGARHSLPELQTSDQGETNH